MVKKNENSKPNLLIHLRPTYPMRNYKFIDKQISIALKNKNFIHINQLFKHLKPHLRCGLNLKNLLNLQ